MLKLLLFFLIKKCYIYTMNIAVKIRRHENQTEYYDLKLSTYKESIEGKFSKEDLRYLIQQIDNEII